jgi:hypothetical protein
VNPSLEQRTIRCKISHELAFPFGYELLFKCFGHITNRDDARFHFCDKPTVWASQFAEILRCNEPYRILRIERMSESDISAHWSFTLYPVKRIVKSIARDALLNASDILNAFLR